MTASMLDRKEENACDSVLHGFCIIHESADI